MTNFEYVLQYLLDKNSVKNTKMEDNLTLLDSILKPTSVIVNKCK